MPNPLHTDEVTEWCPYCREYHWGTSMDALQDEMENICKE